MNTKDIVLIGLLAALLKSSQMILSFLPNIEIVSLLILIFAIRLGAKRTVYITVLFSILNIMLWGLNLATIGYFFVWSGYGVVCSIFKNFKYRNKSSSIFSIIRKYFWRIICTFIFTYGIFLCTFLLDKWIYI